MSAQLKPYSGATMLSVGFPPIAGKDAHTLILGSLPGTMSLARQEYYAKPQNAFWPIMGALFDASPDLPYGARLDRLLAHGIAVWDVCRAAVRPGSLDAAINRARVEPNDFAAFFAQHPSVALVCFNGGTAAELYHRKILPGLPVRHRDIRRVVLPSTSPAHAGMRFAEKLCQWRAAVAADATHPIERMFNNG